MLKNSIILSGDTKKSIEHNSRQGGVFGLAGQAAQRKISICRWNKAVKLIHLNLAYYKKHVKAKSCNLIFLPKKKLICTGLFWVFLYNRLV